MSPFFPYKLKRQVFRFEEGQLAPWEERSAIKSSKRWNFHPSLPPALTRHAQASHPATRQCHQRGRTNRRTTVPFSNHSDSPSTASISLLSSSARSKRAVEKRSATDHTANDSSSVSTLPSSCRHRPRRPGGAGRRSGGARRRRTRSCWSWSCPCSRGGKEQGVRGGEGLEKCMAIDMPSARCHKAGRTFCLDKQTREEIPAVLVIQVMGGH